MQIDWNLWALGVAVVIGPPALSWLVGIYGPRQQYYVVQRVKMYHDSGDKDSRIEAMVLGSSGKPYFRRHLAGVDGVGYFDIRSRALKRDVAQSHFFIFNDYAVANDYFTKTATRIQFEFDADAPANVYLFLVEAASKNWARSAIFRGKNRIELNRQTHDDVRRSLQRGTESA